MPKINVYLPERLASEVKAAGLPVSAICQRALARVLRQVDTQSAVERPTPFGIYGRFLGRARQAFELGLEVAIARRHSEIQAEDLLVGIIQQGSNFAVYIVEALGVAPDDLVVRAYDLSPKGDAPVLAGRANAPLDAAIGPDTRAALSLAARYSATHGAPIGTEHLLYGLAAADGTIASRVLAEFDLDAETIERAMRDHVAAWVAADQADDEGG